MEISSAENQFKLSQAVFEQNSSNANLVCPQCKKQTPSIEEIEMSLMKSPLVRFRCKCLNKKPEESIDLEKYLHILLMEDHSQCLCFKHPEEFASIYCENCSLNMCNLCYSYHVSFEPTHHITPIETEINSPSCPDHLNTELDFFCYDCNMNICIHCAKKIHSDHQVMQLREYWERVNDKLQYQTNESLNSFLSSQISKYYSFTQKQFEKINAIIFNLQQIKAKLELKSKKVQKANQSIGLFVSLIFSDFFKGKHYPNFQLIQNIERIALKDIVAEDSATNNVVFSKYARIDEEIKHLLNNVKDSPPSLIVMIDKRIAPLKSFFIEEFEDTTHQPYLSQKSKDKAGYSCWLNEDNEAKKKNRIHINISNCSTNSTNEEKRIKIIQKEEILKSLNILSNKNDQLNQSYYIDKLEHKTEQFLKNKTYRTEDKHRKNTIQIPRSNYLYPQNTTSSFNQSITPIKNDDLSQFKLKAKKNTQKEVLFNMENFKKKEKMEKDQSNGLVSEEKNPQIRDMKAKDKLFESCCNVYSSKEIHRNTDLIQDELNQIMKTDNKNKLLDTNQPKPCLSKGIHYDQCISTISQTSLVKAIAQLRSGHLIFGAQDPIINIYDSNSFDCISTIETNNNQIYCITELFDGSIAVGLSDNSIKIYDSSSKTCMMVLIRHSKPVTSLVQKDITTLLSCSEDNTIISWDLTTAKCLMTYDEHCNTVSGVIRINETTMVSASKDSTLKQWNYSSNKSLYTIKAHSSAILAIIKLYNDQLATASADKTIKFWDQNLKTCKGVLVGHRDQVSSIVQLTNGNLASCSHDSSMKIWDLKTMTCINTIIVSGLKVTLLIQLFDGSIATVSADSLIKKWV